MAAEQFSRILLKRTTTPLETPTVPAVDDINTFITTDIFEGELYYNIPDGILYTRSGVSIVQLTGLACCNLSDTLSAGNNTSGNNIVITSGDLITSATGKSFLALNPVNNVIGSLDGVIGDARITLDYSSGIDSYYKLNSSTDTSSLLLNDGIAEIKVTDTINKSAGLNVTDNLTVDLYATDNATLSGASFVRVDNTSIILTKDSTSTSNVSKIELTNTKILFSGQSGNRININSNILPSFNDDTAAGVGGLIAGDLYQTTGSGAAPLNAAGMILVKQ